MAEMDFSMYKQPRRDPLGELKSYIQIPNILQENKLLQQQTESTAADIDTKRQAQGDTAMQAAGYYLGARIHGDPNLKITPEIASNWVQELNNMGLLPDEKHARTLMRTGATYPGGYRAYFEALFEAALPKTGQMQEGPPTRDASGKVVPSLYTPQRLHHLAIEGEEPPPAPEAAAPGEVPATGPVAPAAPPAKISGAVPKVPLGTEEATKVTATAASDLHRKAQEAVQTLQERQGTLQNMLQDAAKYRTGMPAEVFKEFGNSWNYVFGTHISEEEIASGDALGKLVDAMSLQLANQMGMSQGSLLSSLGATPNERMSKLGFEKAVAFMQGGVEAATKRAFYLESERQKAAAEGRDPDYFKAQHEFAQNFDLRMYQLPYLNKTDYDDMLAQLEKSGKTKEFLRKAQWAIDNGLIER